MAPTLAGLPSVRWACVSCAAVSIEGEVTEKADRLVLHGCGLKTTLDDRVIAGLWTHGQLHGCGIVLNAADELTCSETWMQQPGGSLRTEGMSETFPLRAALASPEAHAIQSALVTVLRLAGSLRHQTTAFAESDEGSGSCWAAEVEAETREVLRLVLSRYGARPLHCTCAAHALHTRCTDPRSQLG